MLFPDDTFALFVFPTKDKAEKYFAKLSGSLELIKHSRLDLITKDVRLFAVVPGMMIRGLHWKNKRPNMLIINGNIDPEWLVQKAFPAMAEGYTTQYFT